MSHFNLHFPDDSRCWTSFHCLFAIQYNICGEVFVQIFCPFFKLNCLFLITKFREYFIFSEYKSFIRYILWKYFFPFCGLSLHYFNSDFWRAEIFYIGEVCKRLIKQKPQLNRVGSPEGGAPTPCDDNRVQQEERRLFFPGKDSANEKPWNLCLLQPSQLPFPPYESGLLPFPCRDLRVAFRCCRPRIAILCWSQLKPSLLEKYLMVYLFRVNKSNLSTCSFMDCAFGVISMESFPKPRSQKFFLMFSSRSLIIILSCTFKPMIHFCIWCVVRIEFHFLKIWISSCYSTICRKTIPSSLNTFTSLSKISYPDVCRSILFHWSIYLYTLSWLL